MGVPIVLHHVANQPHTPSPHFASLPNGLPGHFLMDYFDCTPTASFTIHFTHHQSAHPQISLHTFPYYRNQPMGPPPSTCFFHQLAPSPGQAILHWGTHFCICIIIPTDFLILFVIKPLFPAFYIAFCHHLWRPSWKTQPMSPLVGALLIIYSC
jgi:hypothetical protein